MTQTFYRALIKTHHITSRKKVAVLKNAAKRLNCYALLRSGGVPGMMFVEGTARTDVQQWVDIVHGLRYKDYQLLASVTESTLPSNATVEEMGVLREVSTIKEIGALMERRGIQTWWRESMGFTPS